MVFSHRLLIAMLAASVSGCMHTGGEQPLSSIAAVSTEYVLPKTSLRAEATLRLQGCKVDQVTVSTRLSATAMPDASTSYSFDPVSLSSWRESQSLTVQVRDDGVISGINAKSEDKTGAIIGNLVSAAASILVPGALSEGAGPMDQGVCKPEALKALQREQEIVAQLEKLTPGWTGIGAGPDMEKIGLLRSQLVSELASLRSDFLTMTISSTIDLTASKPSNGRESVYTVPWPYERLGRWYQGELESYRPSKLHNARILARTSTSQQRSDQMAACNNSISLPQPVIASFELTDRAGVASALTASEETDPTAASTSFAQAKNASSLTVPVQQWGRVTTLCLDTSLFSSRTAALTFSPFGLVTKLEWQSSARGEAASASLSELAPSLSSIIEGTETNDTTQERDTLGLEAELVEQQIRLLKAQRCLEALSAGAKCEE